MLPLDLHVLSLPLAFILSQDQTLHCKNIFLTRRLIIVCLDFRIIEEKYTYYYISIDGSFLFTRSSNELRSCTTCLFMKIFQRTAPADFFAKADAKIRTF